MESLFRCNMFARVIFRLYLEINLMKKKKYCRLLDVDMKTRYKRRKYDSDYYRFFNAF